MIKTYMELRDKLASEGYTKFTFQSFYKNQFKYTSDRYTFTFTPEYRDELSPEVYLMDLVLMDDVSVYDKEAGEIIYDNY